MTKWKLESTSTHNFDNEVDLKVKLYKFIDAGIYWYKLEKFEEKKE